MVVISALNDCNCEIAPQWESQHVGVLFPPTDGTVVCGAQSKRSAVTRARDQVLRAGAGEHAMNVMPTRLNVLSLLEVNGVRDAILRCLDLRDAHRVQTLSWCAWHGARPSTPLALRWLAIAGPCPVHHRSAAWLWLCGGGSLTAREHAADALAAAAVECERQAGGGGELGPLAAVIGPGGEIERDVLRTFPELGMFRPPPGSGLIAANGAPHPPALAALPLSHGVQQLRHVLIAYALARPHVLYCQGMNYVAAAALALLTAAGEVAHEAPERHSGGGRRVGQRMRVVVCLLLALGDRYGLCDVWRPGLPRLDLLAAQLSLVLRQQTPLLHEHLLRIGYGLPILAAQWLLPLGTTALPLNTLATVWEAFFAHGWKALFRVIVCLLAAVQHRVLIMDVAEVSDFFRRWKAAAAVDDSCDGVPTAVSSFLMDFPEMGLLYDPAALMAAARRVKVTRKQLEEAEEAHVQSVVTTKLRAGLGAYPRVPVVVEGAERGGMEGAAGTVESGVTVISRSGDSDAHRAWQVPLLPPFSSSQTPSPVWSQPAACTARAMRAGRKRTAWGTDAAGLGRKRAGTAQVVGPADHHWHAATGPRRGPRSGKGDAWADGWCEDDLPPPPVGLLSPAVRVKGIPGSHRTPTSMLERLTVGTAAQRGDKRPSGSVPPWDGPSLDPAASAVVAWTSVPLHDGALFSVSEVDGDGDGDGEEGDGLEPLHDHWATSSKQLAPYLTRSALLARLQDPTTALLPLYASPPPLDETARAAAVLVRSAAGVADWEATAPLPAAASAVAASTPTVAVGPTATPGRVVRSTPSRTLRALPSPPQPTAPTSPQPSRLHASTPGRDAALSPAPAPSAGWQMSDRAHRLRLDEGPLFYALLHALHVDVEALDEELRRDGVALNDKIVAARAAAADSERGLGALVEAAAAAEGAMQRSLMAKRTAMTELQTIVHAEQGGGGGGSGGGDSRPRHPRPAPSPATAAAVRRFSTAVPTLDAQVHEASTVWQRAVWEVTLARTRHKELVRARDAVMAQLIAVTNQAQEDKAALMVRMWRYLARAGGGGGGGGARMTE